MASCCNPRGCDQFFSPRFARRMAKRYRKRGLDKTARQMVEFLGQRGIAGANVLEIGGGIGEIQIELLKQGAAHTINLELSPAYDEEAATLLGEAGLEGKTERRILDIAVDPDGTEPADVVVLHRVVCCYPDYELLLTAVADHARRLLVFSYPPRNVISRLVVQRPEPRLQAPAQGVQDLRAPARRDARRPRGTRTPRHVRSPPARLASGRARARALDGDDIAAEMVPLSRSARAPRQPGVMLNLFGQAPSLS